MYCGNRSKAWQNEAALGLISGKTSIALPLSSISLSLDWVIRSNATALCTRRLNGRLFVQPLRIPGLSRQWSLAQLRGQPQSLATRTTANVMLEIADDLSRRKDWATPAHS